VGLHRDVEHSTIVIGNDRALPAEPLTAVRIGVWILPSAA
jgi:hypothetical protein